MREGDISLYRMEDPAGKDLMWSEVLEGTLPGCFQLPLLILSGFPLLGGEPPGPLFSRRGLSTPILPAVCGGRSASFQPPGQVQGTEAPLPPRALGQDSDQSPQAPFLPSRDSFYPQFPEHLPFPSHPSCDGSSSTSGTREDRCHPSGSKSLRPCRCWRGGNGRGDPRKGPVVGTQGFMANKLRESLHCKETGGQGLGPASQFWLSTGDRSNSTGFSADLLPVPAGEAGDPRDRYPRPLCPPASAATHRCLCFPHLWPLGEEGAAAEPGCPL